MEYLKQFSEISKNNTDIAGGKGASLGEMTQAGIPVPAGLVILSGAFEKFIKETDLIVEIDAILDQVNHKEIHTIEYASEKIQELIMHAEMPQDIINEIISLFKELNTQYVAVRSSATAEDSSSAAWAGQLESFLNTTENNLLENVKKCWASLFTPRAIFYRFEKDLHKQKISVAVVVQKMVESEKSGIAFSVHPLTQDPNQIIIEAGLGLGEAIVSGQITPDSYVVEKEPRQIIDKNIQTQSRGLYRSDKGGNDWQEISEDEGKKQALTDDEILKLTEIILNIENHYGFPCDIEWAYENGNFYIVQSRPITTLTNQDKKLIFEKSITRDWGMVNSEIWHEIYTVEFEKQFHWGYTDVIFEGKNNNVTIFRAPKEHIDSMRNFIIENILKDRNWMDEQAEKVEEQVNLLVQEIEKIKNQELNNFSIEKLINLLANIFDKFVEIGPRFLIMLWFPIQMEKHERINEFQSEINRATESRTKIEKVGPIVDEITRLFATILCQKLNLDVDLAKYISFEEFKRFFKRIDVSLEKISKRKEYFIITNDGILNENLEDYLIKKNYILKKEVVKDVKNIEGTIAYRGLVRGKVKVITNKGDFNKLSSGEILVTTMTTPDFLPVILKAAAIVTDEGGITCHAAIVAREMQKPCIIGTKIATQILKDGDLVEVDAINGIVRKLTK